MRYGILNLSEIEAISIALEKEAISGTLWPLGVEVIQKSYDPWFQ